MTRRRLAVLPLAAFAVETRAAPKITITGLETFRIKVNKRGDWIIARVRTSAGITGLGDASQSGNTPGMTPACSDILRQLFALMKGRSIYDIEFLRSMGMPQAITSKLPAAVALSALEQCLWDIQGKVFGVPVYDLFGGRIQPRIRQYANINRSTEPRTPEGFADMAARAVADGFDAIKLAPFDEMPGDPSDAAAIEQHTRQGIACCPSRTPESRPDCRPVNRCPQPLRREARPGSGERLEPLNLFWLEEVTPAVPVEDLATINSAAKMPTAGGEHILGVKGFFPYIKAEAVDIVMPDVKFCGGMLELKKNSGDG